MVNTSITMPMPPFNARLSASDLRTTFGRWLPLSKSILIHSRGRGGGWRRPPPPSSTWSFALHPLLCWWTNDQQQLIYFSEVSLEIYFSEVSLENSRRLSNLDSSHCGMTVTNTNLDSSHCGMIVINHSGMIVIKYFLRICSLAWLLRVPMRFKFLLYCCASYLWLLVIDVLLLQWF